MNPIEPIEPNKNKNEFDIRRLPVGPIATNCYILCDRETGKAAVIDPGFEAPRILAELRETGCRAVYIVLTHGHADHMSAAGEVRAATGAPLAVYEGELPLLADPAANLHDSFSGAPFVPLKPEVRFPDGGTLRVGGLTLRALHTPGHTAGSCVLLCGRTMFAGDTLFYEGAGRTDMPTGSAADMARSLRRLAALEGDYRVLPGHGPATTLAHERQSNPFMTAGGFSA